MAVKFKSFDFYRKIPRDKTESTWIGAGLSLLTALFIIIFFAMELRAYLAVDTTTTSVIAAKSANADFFGIKFNISFPSLSCEFASVDVFNSLGMNSLNITKAIHKFPIDPNLQPAGSEFHSEISTRFDKNQNRDEYEEGSVSLKSRTFEIVTHQHAVVLVNFYKPKSVWSDKLMPSWEIASKLIRERYDPVVDGRVLLGKVDCTTEADLCTRYNIQGFPSIRIFWNQTDNGVDRGYDSYSGERDTYSLVEFVKDLVASIPIVNHSLPSVENNTTSLTGRSPSGRGCRVEGVVNLNEVPGYLIFSARSAVHSFDAKKMNMSHVISNLAFGGRFLPKETSEVKRILISYLGENYERLSGRAFITRPDSSDATIEHYIQTIKVEIVSRGKSLVEYAYTGHSNLVQSLDIPVVKFHIQPSPVQFVVTTFVQSFPYFIAKVCAVVGGTFTVGGILASVLHTSIRLLKRKHKNGFVGFQKSFDV